jgi:hypothetical protein
MSVNYGSKRIVVGAGYGFKDWLSQRATAVLMAVFTVLVLIRFLLISGRCVCAAVDESDHLFRDHCAVLACVGGRARHLHGLHQAREHSPVATSDHHRVFSGLRGLDAPSAFKNLIYDATNLVAPHAVLMPAILPNDA